MTYQQSQPSPEGAVGGCPASAHWTNLDYGVRLQLNQFEDGWSWSAWEQITKNGWRPLPRPAAEDVARRFSIQRRAEIFFQRLALLTLPCMPNGER